ncbi:RNA polymerase sigma factor SigY [Dethiothermospora halolimnae]|uniref:RNA polymerase sigma factor SigY n=1 Tax=Dethiothermospora halolimnae TaxID=3114390 RepID=UPI003CCC1D2F
MEEKLIKKAKKGNKDAMEKLLRSNYSILKGYLIKLTLDETIADDITQETMMKAIINIKKYKSTGKFSTWLITIAKNLYRDKLRKDKRITFRDEDKNLTDAKNLEEFIINKTEVEKVKSILNGLPEEKRQVFILKHYYGYSYKEISDIMECPVGTVRSRLHYCIEKIKLQMKGVDDNG